MSNSPAKRAGAVAIGRNEGERLKRCLRSLRDHVPMMVYVDSGSTDGSVEFARSLDVDVVNLDMSQPFTMARARNAGLARLLERDPAIEFVQFVDGDCEVAAGWMDAGLATISAEDDIAAVAGRTRERYPEASRYNRLCDLEWDVPTGESEACGGNALIRVKALQEVEGYREVLIAGEEPDMCFRMRQRGWRVFRLPDEMVLHDAAMTRFGQWWKRATRGGYAYIDGAALNWNADQKYNLKQTRSVLFWGLLLPLLVVALAWPTRGLSLLLLAGYGVLGWRVYRHQRRRGRSASDARLYAGFTVLGKFAMAVGILQYLKNRLLGKRSTLIEYKKAEPSAGI